MKITTGTWDRKSNTFTLSDSKILHATESAISLLIRRGYSHDAACKLLVAIKYQSR